MKFTLTYQAVTEESSEYGDFAHHGFLSRTGNYNPHKNYFPKNPADFSLRDALEIFRNHGGTIEADSCPVSKVNPPRWFSSYTNDWREGCNITLGFHLPRNITSSSALRIHRLLKSY